MPKLTDDEVGALLRETFADKEKLLDQLPKATTRPVRRKAPALLAAAAVIAVLAGTVTVVGRDHQDTARPTPTATAAERAQDAAGKSPSDVVIWAAVISEVVRKGPEEQVGPRLRILAAPKGYPPPPGTGGPQGPAFSAQTRADIERLVVTTVPIEWTDRYRGCENPQPTGRFVAVGPIVGKGGHREVVTFDARGCLYATWATYRIDQEGKVTGVVGTPTGMVPAGGLASPVGRR